IPTTDPGYSISAGTFTISPTSPLPIVKRAKLTIDGNSQTAFTGNTNAAGPAIVLDGANAGLSNGIELDSDNDVVTGLDIQRVQVFGLYINGAFARNNWIWGNYLGTDATGTLIRGNGLNGLDINLGSNNTIGTNGDGASDTAERNVISGNGFGVVINGL